MCVFLFSGLGQFYSFTALVYLYYPGYFKGNYLFLLHNFSHLYKIGFRLIFFSAVLEYLGLPVVIYPCFGSTILPCLLLLVFLYSLLLIWVWKGGGSNVSYCEYDISYFLHFEKSHIHSRKLVFNELMNVFLPQTTKTISS